MKLTAERCKRLINQLSFERDNGGMSNQKFDYLDALEIALPILEQQELGEGDWIDWKGALPDMSRFLDVKYRSGFVDSQRLAGWVDWSDADIVAYRIIPERATNQNGEQ